MNLRTRSFSLDEVLRLMDVFSDDVELRNWFRSLQDMTEPNRTAHLKGMVTGMRSTRERPEIIKVVESLISTDTFNDAIQTVKNIGST
jgi:hypothetical protein